MNKIFFDAFFDTAKMIPILLVIYIGIELIEYKFGNKLREKIQKAGKIGPLAGAIAGSFPQCGFSVLIAALYTQRLVTIGTLLAVFISTSDEAIPVILSQPGKAGIIVPLILTKIIIALVAGYLVDYIFRQKNKEILNHISAYSQGKDEKNHEHESVINEKACCGHSINSSAKKFDANELFFHPIVHTLKIFFFIFVVSFLINYAIFVIGDESFGRFLSNNIALQPVFAALIGLIPNCASSVAITEMYLNGLITFGSAIAGLSASGGLGLLVLFREEKNKKNAIFILTSLFLISVLAGTIIQVVF